MGKCEIYGGHMPSQKKRENYLQNVRQGPLITCQKWTTSINIFQAENLRGQPLDSRGRVGSVLNKQMNSPLTFDDFGNN